MNSPSESSTPEVVVTSATAAVVRHRFSVEQYHEMIEHGIFREDEPIELIRGEVMRKLPIGNPRAATVNRLNRILSKSVPDDAMLSIQNPVWLNDREPEPDAAILKFREDLYASRRPSVEDVLLLIEVADSSFDYDREVKRSVYAEAGVFEYWIVNLNQSTVEVYLDPQPDGRFASARTAGSDESSSPLKVGGLTMKVGAILGCASH